MRVWEQGRWEGVGSRKLGGCGNRGDGRVLAQGRWECLGAGEIGWYGSRGVGRVWETEAYSGF